MTQVGCDGLVGRTRIGIIGPAIGFRPHSLTFSGVARIAILFVMSDSRPALPAPCPALLVKKDAMSIDPYASCPCGSGKAFKFCCKDKPYFDEIQRAERLFDAGQHSAALDAFEKVSEKYPGIAAVWGYKAQFLYRAERAEEADEALQKAFALQPDFPFGHYLRGVIRQGEGELLGALIQFRKAAEVYDSKAHDILGQIHETIADLELRLNRPVAARAALERAKHFNPTNPDLRQVFEGLFGRDSRLPESARTAYAFRPAPAEREPAWRSAIESATSGKLTAAVKAFDQLTEEQPQDSAAWFNLGLVRA